IPTSLNITSQLQVVPTQTDCILPCSFNVGNEVVIHWIRKLGDIQVHSYYYDKDQLGLQNPRYEGRTSLYPEQLGRGNASLRLSNVSVEDEGRYQCYTSTVNGNKETYIQLKVYGTKTFKHWILFTLSCI
uniref:Ig-like domain-containing protein n=1 Tax=Xiphophorus couchianus TaxID=32473 RepID=A0A3B5MI61_9TELE